MFLKNITVFAAVLIWTLGAIAAESGHSPAGHDTHRAHAAAHATAAESSVPGPVISSSADWTRAVLVTIAVMFIAAAVIGPLYRAQMPEEILSIPAHSHDEPPGASGHHGHAGTVDHSAPEKHHH